MVVQVRAKTSLLELCRTQPTFNKVNGNMIELIKRLIFAFRYKKAVKRAVKFRNLTGRKYFVIILKGKPKAVSKRTIKQLIAARRFKPGTKVQDIEKRALFITH